MSATTTPGVKTATRRRRANPVDTTTRARPASPTSTALYDAISRELERADSLTGLLAERLSALDERPDAPSELYALSLVAAGVIDRLQRIHDAARALYKGVAR